MMNRLPVWFQQEIPDKVVLERLHLLSEFNVRTVCQEAKCPNLSYCFKNMELTFMILGNICTRNCRFCAVNKAKDKSEVLDLDKDEPYRISRVVKELDLKYVVITSVTRDDLPDGGAQIFAETVELIHNIDSDIKIEILIPDFMNNILSLKRIVNANPDVVAHNIETVKRLYKDLRPLADYKISLAVLKRIKALNPHLITKSSLILGLGETEREVIETMEDLRYSQCDILTLGQYLSPSPKHLPVKEFIRMEDFDKLHKIGMALGFKTVLSGPKVRSSYQAQDLYRKFCYGHL